MPRDRRLHTASATPLLQRRDLRVGAATRARAAAISCGRAPALQPRAALRRGARARRAPPRTRAPPRRAASPHRRAACASRRCLRAAPRSAARSAVAASSSACGGAARPPAPTRPAPAPGGCPRAREPACEQPQLRHRLIALGLGAPERQLGVGRVEPRDRRLRPRRGRLRRPSPRRSGRRPRRRRALRSPRRSRSARRRLALPFLHATPAAALRAGRHDGVHMHDGLDRSVMRSRPSSSASVSALRCARRPASRDDLRATVARRARRRARARPRMPAAGEEQQHGATMPACTSSGLTGWKRAGAHAFLDDARRAP